MSEIQLSIFDLIPKPKRPQRTEPEVGAYVEDHGAVICRIMREGYVGRKVIYDCSTVSRKWLRCGKLERYFFCHGVWRSVIDVGERQRILLDHYPGREIYEPLSWDEYPERTKAWNERSLLAEARGG